MFQYFECSDTLNVLHTHVLYIVGSIHRWAARSETSSHMWITRIGSKMAKTRNRIRVIVRKMMISEEAVWKCFRYEDEDADANEDMKMKMKRKIIFIMMIINKQFDLRDSSDS